MINKLLLVVAFVLLGDQMISTVNSDANSQCGTINYQFNQEQCIIRDNYFNGTIFCVSPPKPDFIPIRELPRTFKIGVALDVQFDYTYCGSKYYHSWSLEQYLRRRKLGYPNELSEEDSMYCYRHRNLAAVTHLKADFYMRGYPLLPLQWVSKGQFGPLFYRTKISDVSPQSLLQKFSFESIQGYSGYSSNDNIAYFKFFIPYSMKESDPTVMQWRSAEPFKTDFEVGVDLLSACKDGVNDQICEAPKTEIVNQYLESYIPQITTLTEATIKSAILQQSSLQLNLQWSSSELNQFTQQVVEHGFESCKPKLIVVAYESTPASLRGNKNDKIRAVLGTFSRVLAWNASHSQVESAFNLNPDDSDWTSVKRRLTFLKKINTWTEGDDGAMQFYKDWTKDTGLKIAITTCICYSTPWIPDRNRGCREYKHHQLSIDDNYWNSII